MIILLKGKKRCKLQFIAEVRAAVSKFKQKFMSASVLRTPDPNKPFVVEVDASEVGIGGILSQR